VKRFWFEVGVAAKHLPILVPRDKGDLFDGESCFEETAGAFVTQIRTVLDAKQPIVAEVVYRGFTPAGELRHPALKSWQSG